MGHILFSPAKIQDSAKTMGGMGLAPVAVPPAWQRQGIGMHPGQAGYRGPQKPVPSLYHRAGARDVLSRLRNSFALQATAFIAVEGVHEAFMILIVDPPAMQDISGVAPGTGTNSMRRCKRILESLTMIKNFL